jgi:hypothetical protein
MIELIATAVITVASALLFGYWFRYTCLLILSAKTTQDFAAKVATANQLQFLEVQSQLQSQGTNLSLMQDALNRDYVTVCQLLKQADSNDMENRMLGVHFRMMNAWFSVSRQRGALEQMSQVVAHFANSLGEQAYSGAAA